jgi:hypothetical protein
LEVQIERLQMLFKHKSKGVKKKTQEKKEKDRIFNFNFFEEKTLDLFKF